MDKAALRAQMRTRLAALKPLQRAQEEELVNAAVMAEPEWQAAGTVAVYHAKPPELSVVSLVNAAWRTGKAVAFPRVDGDQITMRRVAAWTGLGPGSFGIQEPEAAAPVVEPDLIVVPGLAWTAAGGRLGQGGGHYDRYLSQVPHRPPLFGVGFSVQLLDALPLESHDIAVDRVITPQSIEM